MKKMVIKKYIIIVRNNNIKLLGMELSKFKQDFNDYFNNKLKVSLKYPETYTIDYYADRFILKPNQPSQLLTIIKSNPQLKQDLLKIITEHIRELIPHAYDISFNTDGTNLIIKFNTQDSVYHQKFIPKGHLQIFANIASNLNTVKDIDYWCRTNTEMVALCKDPMFWLELIKQRFPEYYLPNARGYNWERLYKGMLAYDELKNELKNTLASTWRQYGEKGYNLVESQKSHYWIIFSGRYPEAFEYLIINDFIPLNKNDIERILKVYIYGNMNVYEKLLRKYGPFSRIYDQDFNSIIKNQFDNIEFIKLILSVNPQFDPQEVNTLIKNIWKNSYKYLPSYDYPLKDFKFYYELTDESYSYDSLINFLIDHYNIDSETVEYIVSKLPDNIDLDELYYYFEKGIHNANADILSPLWNKYRHLLSTDDIEDLRKEVENLHDIKSRSNLLDIIQ